MSKFNYVMRRLKEGFKKHVKSARGQTESQLIISGFLVFGITLAVIERIANGDKTIAFILFCVNLLTIISFFQTLKMYKAILKDEKYFKTNFEDKGYNIGGNKNGFR